jgi:hypothetical protein
VFLPLFPVLMNIVLTKNVLCKRGNGRKVCQDKNAPTQCKGNSDRCALDNKHSLENLKKLGSLTVAPQIENQH